MSTFTDYIDGLADKDRVLDKDALKELIRSARNDGSEFVRLQAAHIEHWIVMLAEGKVTAAGFTRLVKEMELFTEPGSLQPDAAGKTGAERFAAGIQRLVINGLCKLL